MSDSEDREDQSSQKEDRWLPPRLRAKLDEAPDDDDDDVPQKSSPIGLIITVLVFIGVIAGGWFFWQNYQAQQEAEAERIAAERAKVVADSLAAIARADSIAEAARQDSIDAFNALPRREQRRIIAEQEARARAAAGGGSATSAGSGSGSGASPAPAEPPPAPVESGPFALDAGQFLFEDAAQRAAGELGAATGLEAVVRPVGSGDNQTFHVYLGNFSGRAAAERKANELMSSGAVTQARVVRAP